MCVQKKEFGQFYRQIYTVGQKKWPKLHAYNAVKNIFRTKKLFIGCRKTLYLANLHSHLSHEQTYGFSPVCDLSWAFWHNFNNTICYEGFFQES